MSCLHVLVPWVVPHPGRSEEESSVPLLPVSVYPPVVSGSEEGKKENPSLESLEKLELELDLPEVMAELQVKALEAIHLETAKEECQLRLVAAAGLASTASLRLEPKYTYVCAGGTRLVEQTATRCPLTR